MKTLFKISYSYITNEITFFKTNESSILEEINENKIFIDVLLKDTDTLFFYIENEAEINKYIKILRDIIMSENTLKVKELENRNTSLIYKYSNSILNIN